MLKKEFLFIDTNSTNYEGMYFVNELEIKSKNLNIGDLIIAYQDNEEWDARILFNDGKWGVTLESEARVISNERYEGQQEGYWRGCYSERIILLRLLESLHASDELILEVNKWMGLETES